MFARARLHLLARRRCVSSRFGRNTERHGRDYAIRGLRAMRGYDRVGPIQPNCRCEGKGETTQMVYDPSQRLLLSDGRMNCVQSGVSALGLIDGFMAQRRPSWRWKPRTGGEIGREPGSHGSGVRDEPASAADSPHESPSFRAVISHPAPQGGEIKDS